MYTIYYYDSLIWRGSKQCSRFTIRQNVVILTDILDALTLRDKKRSQLRRGELRSEAVSISQGICILELRWVIVAIYQNDMSRSY